MVVRAVDAPSQGGGKEMGASFCFTHMAREGGPEEGSLELTLNDTEKPEDGRRAFLSAGTAGHPRSTEKFDSYCGCRGGHSKLSHRE